MPRAVIIDPDPRRPWLAQRSARSLQAAGLVPSSSPGIEDLEEPCLLLRAGHVLRHPEAFRPPPLVDAATPLVAVGLPASGDWVTFHRRHGGFYPKDEALPAPVCEWHATGASARERWRGAERCPGATIVHWPPLDLAPTAEAPCVWEVVTSLQQGGAETIARALAIHLPAHGVGARLVVLGKPLRQPLSSPPGTIIDLAALPHAERLPRLIRLACAQGADVLHLHLCDADQTRELSRSGFPVIATVHNASAGWPRGWRTLQGPDLALMLACSQAAGSELREALPGVPVRTVWNGIDPREFPDTPLPAPQEGFVLACVANPRPQKRLERLPAILAATRAELIARGLGESRVRLIIAGELSPVNESLASRAAVDEAAHEHGVTASITWTEGKTPVREVIAEAHVLVSCSGHEGLSLAHLEALSSGRPVVACDTGGTRELAWRNPAMTLLPADATPADFARAIADVLHRPPPSAHRMIWRDFTTDHLAGRVARFVRQTACRPSRPPENLWFITNNLATGGAQSSLRRLLKGLRAQGRDLRVALLQEYPEHPTAGRLDLIGHGIGVFVPPPAGCIAPAESVDRILAEMAAAPPRIVVFWNAITTHKLLLADALPFCPVYDVSPGEMWFTALERGLQDPPLGLPCRVPQDYGNLLAGIVVKYAAEAPRAAALGAPVSIIPNGVTLPPRPLRRADGTGPIILGTAARISPQKRLDELLDAFRLALPELPGAVLHIAGGVESGAEDCAAALRERAADLPVAWLGETTEVSALHAGWDLFVMISDPAGCPNASLEALASGLPVIATDVGGAAEQVVDGRTGRLVPPRDIPALARAMVDLAQDPAARHAMGEHAREHIQQRFGLDRMVRDYTKLWGLA